jgi:hypothetical protein
MKPRCDVVEDPDAGQHSPRSGLVQQVAGANRRWRCQFRCRGSRRSSAVAQLFSFGIIVQTYDYHRNE